LDPVAGKFKQGGGRLPAVILPGGADAKPPQLMLTVPNPQ
jgi:hypothetical protein